MVLNECESSNHFQLKLTKGILERKRKKEGRITHNASANLPNDYRNALEA